MRSMVEAEKEGLIQKWTNYWTGWQPRWMVLNDGILSYYNNEDEVDKGCRASIKLSACDIIAYPADNTRLDVVVKNEQRWYLKTSSPTERQAWLIAMGSSKANAGESATRGDPVLESLRSTMNEVKLFRDLLLQQAVDVKSETEKAVPDTEKLTETTSMLSATCDTFLTSLGRCIDLAETAFALPPAASNLLVNLKQNERGDTTAVPKLQKSRHRKRGPNRTDSTSSIASSLAATHSTPASPSFLIPHVSAAASLPNMNTTNVQFHPSPPLPTSPPPPDEPMLTMMSSLCEQPPSGDDEDVLANTIYLSSPSMEGGDADEYKMLTFFSAMMHSFSDIVLEEDGGIPTTSFLLACEGIIPFLDTIGSKAFAPVKIDFLGNIAKLKTKQNSNPELFVTLQAILHREIATRTTKVRNSATDALLWLKRGLRFIQSFLNNFKDGERDLTLALNAAYSDTLKVYHGWVVKGIFALAVKAAPYSSEFVRALTNNSPENAEDARFINVLVEDIDQYTTAMEVVLNIVDHFYAKNKLESAHVI